MMLDDKLEERTIEAARQLTVAGIPAIPHLPGLVRVENGTVSVEMIEDIGVDAAVSLIRGRGRA